MPAVPPFATTTIWALGAGDGTVVVGDNAASEIHRFHPDGTRSIVRWTTETRPVMPREVEEWKDRQQDASESPRDYRRFVYVSPPVNVVLDPSRGLLARRLSEV